MSGKFGILVYDEGKLRLSKYWRHVTEDDAKFAFEHWMANEPEFRKTHKVLAIAVVLMPTDEHKTLDVEKFSSMDQAPNWVRAWEAA